MNYSNPLNNLKVKFLLCFIFSSAYIFAQNQAEDIVYLKNGSIIKGKVLEMVIGGDIKIETPDGSLFIYKTEDVLKTERKNKPEEKTKNNQSYVKETPSEKYYEEKTEDLSEDGNVNIYMSPGLIIGSNFANSLILFEGINNTALSHSISVGYKLGKSKNYTLGPGVGIQTFQDPMLSLFVDNKYFLGNSKTFKPYLYGQLGYSVLIFNLGDVEDSQGGALIEGGGGLAVKVGKKLHLGLSLGLFYQRHDFTQINFRSINNNGIWSTREERYKVTDIYNRIPLRLNLMF